jgi:glycerol-3-phosphate dehydrogenase
MDEPPLLSVFGGKLTTYRKLAEAALEQLQPWFPDMAGNWTEHATLPGGEQMEHPEQLARSLTQQNPWLPPALALRWARSYGSRSRQLVEGLQTLEQLGEQFGADLYQREVDYLCRVEWALTAEDILWRRSKLGLFLEPGQQARLQDYLSQSR